MTMDVLDELNEVIESRNEDIRRVLGKAESELRACEERCRSIQEQITRARAVLDPASTAAASRPERPLTLHEAMRQVLSEAGPSGLSGPELRDAITSQSLYLQRAGTPVSINQIHARARNYANLFTRRDGRFVLTDLE